MACESGLGYARCVRPDFDRTARKIPGVSDFRNCSGPARFVGASYSLFFLPKPVHLNGGVFCGRFFASSLERAGVQQVSGIDPICGFWAAGHFMPRIQAE